MICPRTEKTCPKRDCPLWSRKYQCCNDVVGTQLLREIHQDLRDLIDVWAKEKWRDVFQRGR